VKVIDGVVPPAVIAPPVIVHAYVTPLTAGIDAAYPALSDRTVSGAKITGVPGLALTVTVAVPLPLPAQRSASVIDATE